MSEINIVELLKLLNSYVPNAYFSILRIDSMMPNACLPDGAPAYEFITRNVEDYSTGCTLDYTMISYIARQFDDLKDLVMVVNKNKNEIFGYDENEQKKFRSNSYLELVIEDLDLVDLYCKDSWIEANIKKNLGKLPIMIKCLP